MTDNEFEAFMRRLERAIDRDTKRVTKASHDTFQADHSADTETHLYNDEWTGQ